MQRLRADLAKEEDPPELHALRDQGFGTTVSLAAEDLLDFEFDPCAMDRSARAWSEFLRAWGVEPEAETVRQFLHLPRPTSEQYVRHFLVPKPALATRTMCKTV